MGTGVILPPNTALVNSVGRVASEWYRFFVAIQKDISTGEVNLQDATLSAGGIATDYSDASRDHDADFSIPIIFVEADDALPLRMDYIEPDDAYPPITVERANLDDSIGLVEQTGFDSFVKRAIGVASATDILTRADGDARYTTPGLSSSLNIRTISATATPASDDYTLLCNAAGGAISVNLPAAASSAKRVMTIKKIDASANAVTIDPNGAELIDGAATISIPTQWQSYTIHCDGSAWYLI